MDLDWDRFLIAQLRNAQYGDVEASHLTMILINGHPQAKRFLVPITYVEDLW